MPRKRKNVESDLASNHIKNSRELSKQLLRAMEKFYGEALRNLKSECKKMVSKGRKRGISK